MLCSHALHIWLKCAVGEKNSGKSLSGCVNDTQSMTCRQKSLCSFLAVCFTSIFKHLCSSWMEIQLSHCDMFFNELLDVFFFFFFYTNLRVDREFIYLCFLPWIAEANHCDVASRWCSGGDPTVDPEVYRVEFACSFRVHPLFSPASCHSSKTCTWARGDLASSHWSQVWLWVWVGVCLRMLAVVSWRLVQAAPCNRDRWLSREKW